VGSVPPNRLRETGVDVVVLCAEEMQHLAPDVFTVRVPLRDSRLTDTEFSRALRAANGVSQAREAGKRVLVTCAAGVNRSALVAAMSLMLHERLPAADAIVQIRHFRRPPVGMMPLSNPTFVEALRVLERKLRRDRV
jgi:protein-tyrosine phosphatase